MVVHSLYEAQAIWGIEEARLLIQNLFADKGDLG
jgi:hypothetical protein